MRKNEIKKVYSMLDGEKFIHEYTLKIHLDGIDIYPTDKKTIYVLDSLIKKIFKIIPDAHIYINFKLGYLRLH